MGYAVLHSVDPKKRRARYYALTWQPSIASDWVVERTWGPLRSWRRQQRVEEAVDPEQARLLVAGHLKRRLHHGYHLAEADGDGRGLRSPASLAVFDEVRG